MSLDDTVAVAGDGLSGQKKLVMSFPDGMHCPFSQHWHPNICCWAWITRSGSNFVWINGHLCIQKHVYFWQGQTQMPNYPNYQGQANKLLLYEWMSYNNKLCDSAQLQIMSDHELLVKLLMTRFWQLRGEDCGHRFKITSLLQLDFLFQSFSSQSGTNRMALDTHGHMRSCRQLQGAMGWGSMTRQWRRQATARGWTARQQPRRVMAPGRLR